MNQQRFNAFVQFLADNADGLMVTRSVTDRVRPVKYEVVEKAILKLSRRRGFSCKKLIRRCRHENWGTRLLTALAERFKGKKRWKSFVRALVAAPAEWWGQYFTVSLGAEILDCPEVMDALKAFLPALEDNEHPLFDVLCLDSHWDSLVRRYIATKDFRRAFDEARKASKGLRVGQPEEDANPFEDKFPRRFSASIRTIGRLIRELFKAMVEQGCVQDRNAVENYELDGKRHYKKVYETKVCGHHAPRAYEQRVKIAGFDFAQIFLVQSRGHHEGKWHDDTFSPEGAMILDMARYFADKKSESRRKKHEKVVAEYQERHQS